MTRRATARPTSGSRGRSVTPSIASRTTSSSAASGRDEKHTDLVADVESEVLAAAREAEAYGTLLDGRVASAKSIFEDVFKEMPPHLQRQRQQMEDGR